MKLTRTLTCAATLLAACSTWAAPPALKAEQVVEPSGNFGVACDSADSMRKLVGHAVAGETTLYRAMLNAQCSDLPQGRYRILSVREGSVVQFTSLASKPYQNTWAVREAFVPLPDTQQK